MRKQRQVSLQAPTEEGSETDEETPGNDTALMGSSSQSPQPGPTNEEEPIVPLDAGATDSPVAGRPASTVPPENSPLNRPRSLRPRQSLRKPEWYRDANNTQ